MRYLFIGGPGRSGTSFVADRLGHHAQVAVLKDIELKIFCEKNGLQDLFNALCVTYSPNRASMALDQFARMTEALIAGRYGQPPLTAHQPAERWRAAFDNFTAELCENGHPMPCPARALFAAARRLLSALASLATPEEGAPPAIFLEKTPHNLLALDFLVDLAPGAQYLHMMRDPRSIAWSLTSMRWGPDDLGTAASWVASYCRIWTAAEARAADLGLPLMCLHIEAAAAEPEATARRITDWLGIAPEATLLAGADPGLLCRWVERATPDRRALLDDRLRGWVRHFGYDPDQIGVRPAETTAEAPDPAPNPPPINA